MQSMLREDRVAVVCCATSNWLPAAAVTLLSCCRFGAPSHTDFIVMLVGGTTADDEAMAAFNAKHSTAIRLQHVEIVEKEILDLGRWLGHGIRLTLNRYLDDRYARVLYLDSDVLALQPIDGLLDADLEGFPLGAVMDVGFMTDVFPSSGKHREEIGFAPDTPYFNSGVLLFDWRKILVEQQLQRTVALLPTRGYSFFSEQDILNVVFRDNWRALPAEWNAITTVAEYISVKSSIRHFTSSPKPWAKASRFADRTFRAFYVKSLAGTSWSNFVDPDGWRWSLKGVERALRRKRAFRKRRLLTMALKRANEAARV
ncbi:glycosyltransferase [Parvibaculum sp.]|uniref:glycosyltransferase family 8 protein n=1 Tax=Parvibaculum sp. TaxID=2024848 RepID=UPI0032115973